MRTPSFSIIVPTYQRRDIVCDAIRRLAGIVYEGELEIIVVVDGSTDSTAEAVEALECLFPRKVVVQQNRGLAAARNRGAAEASGEILLFLDDDMMAAPDLVQQHARSHADGCEVVLGHIPLDPASPPGILASGVSGWADQRAARLSRNEPTLFDLVSGHLSIRRELFELVGGYDESFTQDGAYGDEDLDFAVRLADAHRICFNPDAIASQRYVVRPRDYLRQWFEAGQSDVRFARKHPASASGLFQLHGSEKLSARLLLRPLSAVPGVAGAIGATAAFAAQTEPMLPWPLRRPLAKAFSTARDLVYWRGVRKAGGMPSDRQVLVLCYHAVTDLSGDPVMAQYGIDPSEFARQLDSLLARGFTFISPDEFELLLNGKARVPRRAALLTFDDCYEELVPVARDILQPRGIPAIAFAVSGMKSNSNEWDQRIGARVLRLLDADGLRELSGRGVEIGCHSRSHTPLTKVRGTGLTEETAGAAEDLSSLGLRTPRFFAYPHGAHDEQARAAVRKAGFVAGFGLKPARASADSDRFALPRIEILARDSGWRFAMKTRWPLASLLIQPDPLHVRARRRIGPHLHRFRRRVSRP